jgi:anaerobic selenocysteine-containing dehydrogenase
VEKRVFKSICGFCHSNCGLKIHVQGGKISHIEGDPDHPVNKGYLCSKSRAIKPLVESEDRLKFPLKKTKAGFIKISWDEALDFAADRLVRPRFHHDKLAEPGWQNYDFHRSTGSNCFEQKAVERVE